ncbi:MAG: hypothetical protein AAF614_25570 [Chloroflexota bacterium]
MFTTPTTMGKQLADVSGSLKGQGEVEQLVAKETLMKVSKKTNRVQKKSSQQRTGLRVKTAVQAGNPQICKMAVRMGNEHLCNIDN